jgi:hypothetical protein
LWRFEACLRGGEEKAFFAKRKSLSANADFLVTDFTIRSQMVNKKPDPANLKIRSQIIGSGKAVLMVMQGSLSV